MEKNRPNTLTKDRSKRNQKKLEEDYEYGILGEMFSKPHLEKLYGKLTKTRKYDTIDFYNKRYWIELKSRRYKHDAFDFCGGLFFNIEKIEITKRLNEERIRRGKKPRKVIFAFNCIDGLYYWEYDGGEYTIGEGGRTDRDCDERGRVAKVLSKDMTLIIEKEKVCYLDSDDE